MSESIFLCLLALVIAALYIWLYMLFNAISNDLEKIKKKLIELNADFTRYRINNPPRD